MAGVHTMVKINVVVDVDKADLKQQYQWAQDRLDAIISEPAWTNAKVISAVQDEAKILRKLLRLTKKLVLYEIK